MSAFELLVTRATDERKSSSSFSCEHSEAIRDNQRKSSSSFSCEHSEAIRGNQRKSSSSFSCVARGGMRALRGAQRLSEAFRGFQRRSEAIRGAPYVIRRPDDMELATLGNQRQSEALRTSLGDLTIWNWPP